MLGINAIHRLLDSQHHARVVEGCLCATPPLPLSIRLQLQSDGNQETVALALGLQRVLELSYRITADAASLASRLLSTQRPDGGFGNEENTSPTVTIQALAALASYRARLSRDPRTGLVGFEGRGLSASVESAIERACGHLREKRCVSDDRMVNTRETTAYLYLMMARHPELRVCLDIASIEEDLLEAGCQHDRAARRLFEHARRLLHAQRTRPSRTPTAA
jgi:hypothetical protein